MPEPDLTSKYAIEMQAREDRVFQAVLYAAVGAVCAAAFVFGELLDWEQRYHLWHHQAFMPHYYYPLFCGSAALIGGIVGGLIGYRRPLWKSAV